jgi:L-threonylcarbamoyladenylate synthase
MNFEQFITPCSTDANSHASQNLLAGHLVAFPTETVYGLGADACNPDAVARVFKVKGRPNDNPLIVHIASWDLVRDWAKDVPQFAVKLAQNFWPGPMTLVFKRTLLASDFVTGGQDTVGLRVPGNRDALNLLQAFQKLGGKGIAAPSANRFGYVSPTTAKAVVTELGQYLAENDLVLDGGPCKIGLESTIIDCTGRVPRVLRPGSISKAMIEKVIEERIGFTSSLDSDQELAIRVSGSSTHHYSPKAKVILSDTALPGQGLIAHESVKTPFGVIRLASPKNDEEFARLLYSALREADEIGLAEVAVFQPLGDGIAIAIRDRLSRAANGRFLEQ